MAELTKRQKQRIHHLVTHSCANYFCECGCLLLEDECYMFGIAFTESKLCRYFEKAVLPLDAELDAALHTLPVKRCKVCGKSFAAAGNKQYCSANCASFMRRLRTAERVRKHRQK